MLAELPGQMLLKGATCKLIHHTLEQLFSQVFCSAGDLGTGSRSTSSIWLAFHRSLKVPQQQVDGRRRQKLVGTTERRDASSPPVKAPLALPDGSATKLPDTPTCFMCPEATSDLVLVATLANMTLPQPCLRLDPNSNSRAITGYAYTNEQ